MTIPSPIISPRWSAYSEPRDIKIGISDPTNGYGAALVQSLDRFTGRRTHVINIFIRLDDATWQTKVGNIVKAGYMPMITVEPWMLITDAQLSSFWAYIATIGQCYVRFAHEMNGNWYPWGNDDPSDFATSWLLFFKARTPNALRVWCVNSGDIPITGYKAEAYYPGDDQVDLIGIDGYNDATKSPADVFGSMLARMKAITSKPMGICEWGTINSPNKGQWITQLYDYVIANNLSYVAGWNADRPLAYGIFGQSGGNTTFTDPVTQVKYNAYLEYAAAVVKLDSRYK